MERPDADNLAALLEISREAGKAVLDVYHSDFAVENKEDHSPLTLADKKSHEILSAFLSKNSSFPVLSEEGKDIPYRKRKNWERFWLIDPLDGTKEFIKRNGEFTINVALIRRGKPVAGIIYAPVKDVLYHAAKGKGVYKIEGGKTSRLPDKNGNGTLTVAGSRSHGTRELEEYVQGLRERYGEVAFLPAGSSLKFCLVAEGLADIYPRLGPTMEWDTAAGQVIVEEAGGSVVEWGSTRPLEYNKENLLNPHFIAFRGGRYA